MWERPWLAWGVLRKAQRVTAVSPYVAESLHRFPWPQRDIAVVCNGVPQAVFDLYAKRHIWPRSNKLVFASVLNGWRGRKNGQELIKAFSLVREVLGEGVELWMFGEGHQQDGPAHAWAAERLLDQGIHFGGTLPYGDLLDRLTREVDVLVHPALEESFGMVLAEAMAIGLPVVAGRNSGATAWVLADGEAGMLVDVNSPPSIAAGLRTVAEDARLRARLASAGRERALKEYHIDLTVTRYEEILGGASME
jgi:glycosyltransferase involved in cell wall biosynthesis